MAADDIDGYPSREDRIVAEFGDGFDVEGIAFRYGLTVAQVYAVIERELGADPGLPTPPSQDPPQGHYLPPPGQGYYGPPAYQVQHHAPPADYAPLGYEGPAQGFLDEDAIVAEYGEGYDVDWIAVKHGISVERVYEVIQRIAGDDLRPPAGLSG